MRAPALQPVAAAVLRSLSSPAVRVLLCTLPLAGAPALAQELSGASAGGSGASSGAGEAGATGSGAASARGLSLVPAVDLSETITDNARLASAERRVEAVTQVTARAALRVQAPELQGLLDYALTGIAYSRRSEDNTLRHTLNATAQSELISKRLNLSAGASVSRSALSAFGAGVGNGELVNNNSAEVRSVRLGSTLQGALPFDLRYAGRLNWSRSMVVDGSQGDSSARSLGVQLNPARPGPLGWSVDLGRELSSRALGDDLVTDQLTGSLRYSLTAADTQLRGSAGVERSNLGLSRDETRPTWSLGATWTPSPRTSLSADYGERFHGRNYALAASYRTALTVWQASAGRSLNVGNGQAAAGSMSQEFYLLYALLASAVPDPETRRNQVIAYLRGLGKDPFASGSASYLTSAATVADTLQFSAAWRQSRQSAVLTLSQSRSRRADGGNSAVDDLSNTGTLRTRSLSLSLSHQLRPDASLSLNGVLSAADGDLSSQHSRQRQINLLWTQALGRSLSVSAGLRRSLNEVQPANSAESALTLNLSARF